jgi:hypothetical protein
VASWVDGQLAADEQPLGRGCVRHVAIRLPGTGDLVLRRSVGQLVNALSGPCGGTLRSGPADDSATARLTRPGPLLAAGLAPQAPHMASSTSAWLLAGAALVLGLEMLLRGRGRSSA